MSTLWAFTGETNSIVLLPEALTGIQNYYKFIIYNDKLMVYKLVLCEIFDKIDKNRILFQNLVRNPS